MEVLLIRVDRERSVNILYAVRDWALVQDPDRCYFIVAGYDGKAVLVTDASSWEEILRLKAFIASKFEELDADRVRFPYPKG